MRRLGAVVGLVAGLACGGGGGGDGDSDGSTGQDSAGTEGEGETETGGVEEPRGCGDDMFQLGSAPLRRLTREQYNNTVRDLLGDDSRPADAFPADDITIGFAVPGAVSPLAAQHYMDAAESLAAGAADMLPCEPSDACAHEFIEDFATRAFRREVGPAELDRLEALFADANDQFGYDAAIETVVEFVLQSPQFLYRRGARRGLGRRDRTADSLRDGVAAELPAVEHDARRRAVGRGGRRRAAHDGAARGPGAAFARRSGGRTTRSRASTASGSASKGWTRRAATIRCGTKRSPPRWCRRRSASLAR